MSKVNYTLYLVTDERLMKVGSLTELVEEAIIGGVTLVQLRDKNRDINELTDAAIKIKRITDKYNVPLIINDSYKVAKEIKAAGVHIGQEDTDISIVRKYINKEQIVGVSVSNITQAIKAENAGADYLGIGPIFPTNTKLIKNNYVSIEKLKEICKIVKIPCVAIGGIKIHNLNLLKETGIAGVAVVSEIVHKNKDEIKIISKSFKKQLRFI